MSTYPDYCKIELERRTLPGEDKTTVTEEIQDILRELQSQDGQLKADSNVFFFRPAFEIAQEKPIVQTVGRAYESIQHTSPKFRGIGGWNESALLAEAGIQAVSFGPRGEGAHAFVEYVDIDSVTTTTNVLIEAIVDFCNG